MSTRFFPLTKHYANIFFSRLAECGERTINLAIFTNTFIMGAGCFVGNLIATFMATKMQARVLAGGPFNSNKKEGFSFNFQPFSWKSEGPV